MDKIPSALQAALGGIERNLRRLDAAAGEIATAPVRRMEPTGLDRPLVAALEAQRALEASAAVLRRASQTFDSVLEALRA